MDLTAGARRRDATRIADTGDHASRSRIAPSAAPPDLRRPSRRA
jgi:hypothetical protein